MLGAVLYFTAKGPSHSNTRPPCVPTYNRYPSADQASENTAAGPVPD